MGLQRVWHDWGTELNWTEISGREHSPIHQQITGLKIYWAWPHPSEQDPVSLLVSLSHQETCISLLSFSIIRQTESHNHRKLTNLITWTTALSNSMKLWAMLHVELPKMEGSWWRVLTKCGPLEKGMANHFHILALRTPWMVWKGKKIWHWKTIVNNTVLHIWKLLRDWILKVVITR